MRGIEPTSTAYVSALRLTAGPRQLTKGFRASKYLAVLRPVNQCGFRANLIGQL